MRCLCAHADARAHLNVHNFALKDSLTSHEVGEKAPPTALCPSLFQRHNVAFYQKIERLFVSLNDPIYLFERRTAASAVRKGLHRHCRLDSGICCSVSVTDFLCP